MNWKRLTLVTLISATLLACASEEDSILVAPLPEIKSEFVPIEKWNTKIGKGVGNYYSKLTPASGYDKIFSADRQGVVQALDPQSGKMIWQVKLGGKKESAQLAGGLTLGFGKLFVGSEKGQLFALDAMTGETLWQVEVSGELLAKPLADAGLVIVNSSTGELAAFDAETGASRWKITSDVPSLTLRGDSSPISISGGVFWGMANGRLSAALMENGNIIWQQPIATPKGATEIDRLVDIDAAPVIADSLLYAVGYNGQVVAIELESGRLSWKRNYSATNDFLVVGNYLFLTTSKDHIVALDSRSGTELWQNRELENRQLTAPVAISGYVVVGDAQGYLHWLDPSSGEFVAQQLVDDSGITAPPLRLDDGYVVQARNGRLIKLQTP